MSDDKPNDKRKELISDWRVGLKFMLASSVLRRRLYIILVTVLANAFTHVLEIVCLGVMALFISSKFFVSNQEMPLILTLFNEKPWLLILVVALGYGLNFGVTVLVHFQGQRLGSDLGVEIFRQRFLDPRILEIQSKNGRLTTDIGVEVSRFTQQFFMPMVAFILKLAVIGVIAGYSLLNWPLISLIVIVLLCGAYWCLWYLTRGKVYKLSENVALFLQERISQLDAFSKGYKYFWASRNSLQPIQRFDSASVKYADAQAQVAAFSILPKASIEVTTIICLAVAAIYVETRQLESIQFLDIAQLAVITLKLVPNFSGLYGAYTNLRANYSTLEIFHRNGNEPSNTQTFNKLENDGDGHQQITVELPANFSIQKMNYHNSQIVLLVGASGSGKTTFFDGLVGLRNYDNDIRIGDSPVMSLKHKISYVPQDSYIFEGSISQNLFIDDETPEDKLLKAWQICGLSNVTGGTFDLNHHIYPGQISGGQKQRIAVARAMLEEKPIIIFDESFSGIDTDSSKSILKALKCNFQNMILLTSHDESFVQVADKVIFVESLKSKDTERL